MLDAIADALQGWAMPYYELRTTPQVLVFIARYLIEGAKDVLLIFVLLKFLGW